MAEVTGIELYKVTASYDGSGNEDPNYQFLFSCGIRVSSAVAGEKIRCTLGVQHPGSVEVYEPIWWDVPVQNSITDSGAGAVITSRLGANYPDLFCGESFTFFLRTLNFDSNKKTVFLPPACEIPDSFVISERATIHNQFVVYDGELQGEGWSCVANALMAAKEVQEMRSNRGHILGSVGWFYGATALPDDQGTPYADALNFLRDNGVKPWHKVMTDRVTEYPDNYFYNDALELYMANQDVTDALPQKIKSWKQLASRNDLGVGFHWQSIFDALQQTNGKESKCVLMSLDTDTAFDEARDGGLVGVEGGEIITGHMMLVLGWKTIDGKKYWICQNSWGKDWGDDGICYLPFSNVLHQIWGFYEIEDDPDAPEPPLEPWRWDASNGTATAEETRRAFKILNGESPVSDGFSCKVWNDLVDKISQVRVALGAGDWSVYDDEKNVQYLPKDQCWVQDGDTLSAKIYNSVRYNIGSVRSTGVTDKNAGDEILGCLVTKLTDAVNEAVGETADKI